MPLAQESLPQGSIRQKCANTSKIGAKTARDAETHGGLATHGSALQLKVDGRRERRRINPYEESKSRNEAQGHIGP